MFQANAKHDATRAAKINAIRANARGIEVEELAQQPCPTCQGKAGHPRVMATDDRGYVLSMCVDAHHHGHIHVGVAKQAFYARAEAQGIRKAELDRLQG